MLGINTTDLSKLVTERGREIIIPIMPLANVYNVGLEYFSLHGSILVWF